MNSIVFSPVPVDPPPVADVGPFFVGKADVKKGALKGLKMGIRSEWPSNVTFMTEMQKILISEYGVVDEVPWWDLQSDEGTPFIEGGRTNVGRINRFYEELCRERDFVVLGLAT